MLRYAYALLRRETVPAEASGQTFQIVCEQPSLLPSPFVRRLLFKSGVVVEETISVGVGDVAPEDSADGGMAMYLSQNFVQDAVRP